MIEGRSGLGAIIGGEGTRPPMFSRGRHQDKEPGRIVRPTARQGGTRGIYEEDSWYEEKCCDTEEEPQSNREAHARAGYQQREDEDREHEWITYLIKKELAMEARRYSWYGNKKEEEMEQDRNRRDQERRTEPGQNTYHTLREDTTPARRSEYQTQTRSETPLPIRHEEKGGAHRNIGEDNYRESRERRQSPSPCLGTRFHEPLQLAETQHSMATSSKKFDSLVPTTSDKPQSMASAPDPGTPLHPSKLSN